MNAMKFSEHRNPNFERAIFLLLSGLIVLFTMTFSAIAKMEKALDDISESLNSIEESMEESMAELKNSVNALEKEVSELKEEVEVLQSYIESVPEEPSLPYSDAEIDLIAVVTMAEAESEPEEGKRLVIDVVLNRVESPRFANTVTDVVYAPNQFTSMTNGRANKCYARSDIVQLVKEEIVSRTNSSVLYFRSDHYHDFGTPIMKVGNHYFSGL